MTHPWIVSNFSSVSDSVEEPKLVAADEFGLRSEDAALVEQRCFDVASSSAMMAVIGDWQNADPEERSYAVLATRREHRAMMNQQTLM